MQSEKIHKNIISISVVLFNTKIDELNKLLNSLISIKIPHKIFIIDNSPTNKLLKNLSNFNIEYIFNPSNPGFGSSHNLAIQKSIDLGYKYHLVVNPDIYFNDHVVESLLEVLNKDPQVGMIMPQILNFNGSIQNLPKLLPSPYSILLRKFKFPRFIYKKFINKYELRFVPREIVYNSPVLSGCFTILNLKAINEVGMYDDNFFMYFEDWDLSRRIHDKFITLYYPKVSVYHGYDSGANKSLKLFIIYLKSAFYYFNKWGWFCDKKRKNINLNTLLQFEK